MGFRAPSAAKLTASIIRSMDTSLLEDSVSKLPVLALFGQKCIICVVQIVLRRENNGDVAGRHQFLSHYEAVCSDMPQPLFQQPSPGPASLASLASVDCAYGSTIPALHFPRVA